MNTLKYIYLKIKNFVFNKYTSGSILILIMCYYIDKNRRLNNISVKLSYFLLGNNIFMKNLFFNKINQF